MGGDKEKETVERRKGKKRERRWLHGKGGLKKMEMTEGKYKED